MVHMTNTATTTPALETDAPDDGWREAGAAWGHAAIDWAYLFEPYGRDAAEHIFNVTGVEAGTDLLDIACGSGSATARAARRGANVAGLDASLELLEIAARRTPAGRFHAGSMFSLPYDDESFDVITSFNGIWGGCDAAMVEAARVLRPGGWFAITFWGPGDRLDFRDMFLTLGGCTESTKDEMIGLASIGAPGIAEGMFSAVGFEIVERAETQAVHEAVELGDDGLRAVLLPTLEPFRAPDGSYRTVNELTHVIGRKTV
jgi:SAM-dependent methyltransferase